MLVCPIQIPHGLNWNRNWTYEATNRKDRDVAKPAIRV